MRHTYFVIDQNYLRAPQLEELLATQPRTRIVVPDLAMFEMTKSSERALTVRSSLATLAKYADRVFVSRTIGECLKYELEHAQPVTGHMLFREATHFLRRVLSAVVTGRENPEFERVIHDPENCLLDLNQDYLDHDSNKQRSLELVDATKSEMTAEFAKRIRGRRVAREEKIAFIREKAPSLLIYVLEDNGFTREKACHLVRKESMLLRYFYVKLWACLDWAEHGRLDNLGAVKVSNDLLDQQYVLSATFFDGVLSCDARVNDAYLATMNLLAVRVLTPPAPP